MQSSLFGNNEIKHAIIPDHITSVTGTFMGNPIEKITIGISLTNLGMYTFSNTNVQKYSGANFLTEVYIPKNVTSIGNGVFQSATKDVTIYVENLESAMTLGSSWQGQSNVIFGEEPVTTEQ